MWSCPNLVCKGSVAAFKGTYSGITVPCIVRGREENTVALVAYWGALCLHTAPTETYFLSKGRNFGNTSSSSLVLLVVISNLYFVNAYVVVYLLLVLVDLVVSFDMSTCLPCSDTHNSSYDYFGEGLSLGV